VTRRGATAALDGYDDVQNVYTNLA